MRAGTICLAAFLLAACAPKLEELSRRSTNDGLVEVVAYARQTDATVPTPTEIYVLPAGGSPSDDAVWRADNIRGLALSWSADNVLWVQADEARVFLERDHVEVRIKGGPVRSVEVRYRIEKRL